MDPIVGTIAAMISAVIVTGVGLILIDGPAVLFRARDTAASEAPPRPPDRGPPFRPPELPPLNMKWPSETPRPPSTTPTLRWPSSSWNDPHFGAAARARTEVDDAARAAEARAAEARAADPRAADPRAGARSPAPRTSDPAPPAKAVPARSAASLRRAAEPEAGVGQLDTPEAVQLALDTHGLGAVVEALSSQRGWNAKQIASYLRALRDGR